jgi:hypothetical protein
LVLFRVRFFISVRCRRARATTVLKDAGILDPADAMYRRELEAEERRKQSHDMVAESIKRELAESKTGCPVCLLQ